MPVLPKSGALLYNLATTYRQALKDPATARQVMKQAMVADPSYPDAPLVLGISLHTFIVGQPFRIRALHDFLAYARSFDDVWWATREEIAEWYLKNHQSHIA